MTRLARILVLCALWACSSARHDGGVKSPADDAGVQQDGGTHVRPDAGGAGDGDVAPDHDAAVEHDAGSPIAELTPNANYPGSRAPLAETPFIPLPIGAVRADGWLRTQLELQRDGLTGMAESLYGELNDSSPWRGGDNANAAWGERAPYYVKGLVALAYVLDDATLKAKAQVWLDWTLDHQRDDGYLGPPQLENAGDGMNMWGRVPMLYALKDYAEATDDARVLPALSKFFHWQAGALSGSPLTSWARSRAGDIIDVVHWLYNRTGDAALLDHSDQLRNAAYPFSELYGAGQFINDTGDFQPKHNVNVQQDIKAPAINAVRTNADVDRNAFMNGHNQLFHRHGQVHGAESGTEMLSGDSSTAGIELCSIVERMQSNEEAQMILGDPELGDQLERLAFNALPGSITKDFKALQYFTLPNQVESTHGSHGFEQDYGNAITPSPTSGYPCCRFNMHMGWPYFVKNMWAATLDSGLAIMAYGPSHVSAKVADGVEIGVTEETNYPFAEQVRLTVHAPKDVAFPLKVRIPAWSAEAKVTVNGKAQSGVRSAAFYAIRRVWSDGDTVVIDLPAALSTSRWINQSVSVEKGPLLFSLELKEHQNASDPGGDLGLGLTKQQGFSELEITPSNAWRYALALDPEKPADSLTVQTRDMPANPFVQATTPVYLKGKARLLSYWGMDPANSTSAAEPPFPAVTTSAAEDVQLVPFGAENIRVTYFPLAIGESKRFEAESGAFAGGASTNDDHPGFSGTGFSDFKATNGASVSIELPGAPEGLQYLTVRYAAGAGDSSTTVVKVNGVALPDVLFRGTNDWNSWADSTPLLATLGAGANHVEIANGTGKPINVDFVSVSPFAGAYYEGESAALAGGAKVMTEHPKYSGSGFVDFNSINGSSATFHVPAKNAGAHNLIVRYAAGQGLPVTGMQLYVNGALQPATSFAATGSWRVWQSSDALLVTLNAGDNTLEFRNGAAPYMNIDAITVLPRAELPCERALPTASITPPLGTVAASGGEATYLLTLTNPDRGACADALLHVSASALGLAGARIEFADNDLTVAHGKSVQTMLTVRAPSNASAATYLVHTWVQNRASAQTGIATAGLEVQ